MKTDKQIKNYEITMLTFDEKVPVGPSGAPKYAPWYEYKKAGSIILSSAKESTIVVSDDDDVFGSNYAKISSTENMQEVQKNLSKLHPDTSADKFFPDNVKLKNSIRSVLQADDSSGVKPDQFTAMFPTVLDENKPWGITHLGDKKSVLIIPIAKDDGTFPHFDKKRTFHFVEQVAESVDMVKQPRYARIHQPEAKDSNITCFGEGTLIRTAKGERPIETLQCGDLVETLDQGLRHIHWIGKKRVAADDLDAHPNLKPVLIRPGALGPDTPDRNLVLSPQHRVLLRNNIAQELFGDSELLVAVKHLLSLPGIRVVTPKDGITYWHILFDRHQIVMSNGAWTESLFTGPYAMSCLSEEARREILGLFPQLAAPSFRPRPARRLIKAKEANTLIRRQRQHQRHRRHRTVNFHLQFPKAA